MKPLLECCDQNLANGTRALLEKSGINLRVDLVTYSCMNECVICAQFYSALFEGEPIVDATLEGFEEKLLQKIADWESEFE